MLVDANLLIYARDESSPHHPESARWLTAKFNGQERVGLPWPSLLAFLRLSTHPRAFATPLAPQAAWTQIEEWLAADTAWIPAPTTRHAEVLGGLVRRYDLRSNLIPDADLVALAIEHGLTVCSADTDFARFDEIRWLNPLAGPKPR